MKKILLVLLIAFVVIQFFPIDKTNPPLTQQLDFINIKKTPESTAKLLRNGCYDCHSNETKYPWYSNIQPFAWFLQNHIQDGRKHLNFSTFATYEYKRQAHKLAEAREMVDTDEMPLQSYIILHPQARLSGAEKQELSHYFKLKEEDIRRENNLPPEEKELK